MIKSLEMMENPRQYLEEPWLKFLYRTRQTNYNIGHLESVNKLSHSLVYEYVKRNLEILEEMCEQQKLERKVIYYVEETLKWSEVAKAGTQAERNRWQKKGYDLFVHNIGSSQIYQEYGQDEVVRVLIKTHGLIGQYIKGEVLFNKNEDLYQLVKTKKISKDILRKVLIVLNACIIRSVSEEIYRNCEKELTHCIDLILEGKFDENTKTIPYTIRRLTRLRGNLSDEEKEYLEDLLCNKTIFQLLQKVWNHLELWYFDVAFPEFSLEEQIKVLLLISYNMENDNHVTFEKIMKTIYIDYRGKKMVNIYKKRIIEKYLQQVTLEDIIKQNIAPNPHISYSIRHQGNTMMFDFIFSPQANKLIEFCEIAYTSNTLYQKAVFILYDLFGFRRDEYDRFYNEIDYLNTMNKSLQHKAKILDYMVGSTVLDVGPGGGALMDLIAEKNPSLEVLGIDLSQNVIDTLAVKKAKENRTWKVVKGDALHLDHYFDVESIDTIIYSSIIHELYSYIETDHHRFNKETIRQTLQSAYRVLAPQGRIIIRDGIMTEPINQMRYIEFKNEEDLDILKRYCHDFKGRKITYEQINDNTVKMLVNDAMEFLYTYTWGENSYSLEVKEQFGYFTPSEYIDFIYETLGNVKIVFCKAFLQDGYEQNLLNKISIFDEQGQVVKLPNSTCILVIEK